MLHLRHLAVASGVWLLAGILLSGHQLGGQERPWPAVFGETTEVKVVNVRVVVTDAEDRPVKGLQREDFQLFVDGQEIAISNFYAVEDGRAAPMEGSASLADLQTPATPEPHPTDEERHLQLVLFVDNANISVTNRSRALSHLREFLLKSWRRNMRVMLVSYERSVAIRQGFTTTPHEIFVALDELEKRSTGQKRFDADRRNLARAIEDLNVEAASHFVHTKGEEDLRPRVLLEATTLLPQIRAYSQQLHDHVRQSLSALTLIVDTVAALPGQKAIVYVGDNLPLRPGEDLFETYARQVSILSEVSGDLSPASEISTYDATSEFLDLVAHANSSQVTFYALNASPALASGSSAESRDTLWGSGVASTAESSTQESLILMAQATGGAVARSASNIDTILGTITSDFENYYSLGFLAEGLVDGGRRSLEVKVRGGDRRLRHRASFDSTSVDEQMAQETLLALLADVAMNPLEIALETRQPRPREDGSFEVPLLVEIPLGNLILVPGKSEHRADVSMFVATRDEQGRMSRVVKHLCPIRIPNSEVLVALGRSAACGVGLLMRSGPQKVAVSVRDELAAVSATAQLALEVGSDEDPEEDPEELP